MQYKSSKYKYIPSRLYQPKKKTGIENTDNNFMNYEQYHYQYQQHDKQQKKIISPNSAFVGTKKNQKPSSNNQEPKYIYNQINNIGEGEQKTISMFDKYYKEKNENKDYQMNPNYFNDLEKEIFQNQKEENNNINIKDVNVNKEVEKENENMRKAINRQSKEINHQKNFIETNKNLITKIQNANNSNKLKEYYDKKENPYHKEYGKIPKYIENMKLENEKKLQTEKLRKETAKYPKGTRLLSEEERLFTLEKLKQSRDDINKVIERLPITPDTQAFKNKKEELFKKLDEIENAIETFSKKKVFVKVEDK
jgi:hypothetical protein